MKNCKTSNPARHLASSVPMQSLFNKWKFKMDFSPTKISFSDTCLI